MVKIYLSTPCYNSSMLVDYTISLLNTIQYLAMNGIQFEFDFVGNESLIQRARNRAIDKFLKSDCTHLLFIDSDISFPHDAILDLIRTDKDVVGCAYPKKEINTNRLLMSLQIEKDSIENHDSRLLEFVYNVDRDENNNIIRNGDYIKARHIGTGFMLIKRDIINRLCEKHTELMIKEGPNLPEYCGLFCCLIKDKEFLSEDYSFCDRVTEIGGEVWLNIKHNLTHVGLHRFKSDIKNRRDIY